MSAIPFGLVGAVIGHKCMGFNLSLLSMFGIVALTGVVVNDSLILIDLINRKRREEIDLTQVVRDSAVRRFRPIILTTLTTFLGLTPIILEKSLQARFLIPMALAIAAGVLFATILTLVLVPSLLTILSDFRLLIHRFRYGYWPKRVEVEPALQRHEDPLADGIDTHTKPTTLFLGTDTLKKQ